MARKQEKMDQAVDALLLLQRIGIGYGTDHPTVSLTILSAVTTKIGPHAVSKRNLLNHLNALQADGRVRRHTIDRTAAHSWEVIGVEADFVSDVVLPAWEPA
jgi:hypothetical protein|tara:strand:+ start:1870 stop:2175 length:306 start_codon:yes stop_codon:yes gene_type:complete